MSRLLVLCYHAVSATWRADLSLAPERLEAQLASLLRRGYRPARFTDAVLEPRRQATLVVTFDDAFRSVLELAAPILARLGVPGTVFVPTDFMGHAGPASWPGVDQWVGTLHELELTPLRWDELAGLAEAGWEIGSHTCSHPHLTTLDDTELERELANSKMRCEDELGSPCDSLAYPYGDVDPRVRDAAGRAGYRAAATLTRLPHRSAPLAVPRVGVWNRTSVLSFAVKVSRPFRALPGPAPA